MVPLLGGDRNDVAASDAMMVTDQDQGHAAALVAPYAQPRPVTSIDDCYFYHSMDVPGFGSIEGEWDLRGVIGDYLGHFDFAGKRVLDVGAASGMLSFFMESQGADVVSFDLSEDFDWDIVPFAENDNDATRSERRRHLRKINNGYWLAHAALGSRAKMVNGVVYEMPASIGRIDVAVFGSILLHLRDPFLALENAARLSPDTIIVADLSPYGRLASKFRRTPKFMPRGARPRGINDGWYRLPPLLVQEFLAILGYKNCTLTWNNFKYGNRVRPLYTLIARR